MAHDLARLNINETVYDSKLEAEYARRLEMLMMAGEIRSWWYKPLRLRISNEPSASKKKTAFYTPDFAVLTNDGFYELHETKGVWKEAAWVRIRAAALIHPFKFVAIYKEKGSFIREDI